MSAVEIARVGTTRDLLGEGLLWDGAAGVLYWVDALSHIIRRRNASTGTTEEFRLPAPIGAIALRRSGGAMLTMQDGFYAFDFATGALTSVATLPVDVPHLRFNDGTVDRQGRFIAGTMHVKHPADPNEFRGTVYRLDGDLSTHALENHVGVFNGPCFSPDGKTFYFADSLRKTIWAYDYDVATGALAQKRVLADVSVLGATPDGGTVDAEGYLWSALITAGKIVRLAPDGRLDRTIELPVRYPTNVAFGGPDLDILYATSISKSVNFEDKGADSGGLFAIAGLGVKGLAEQRFAG